MYAVIKTGGKQYKVAKNDVIQVEKLAGEAGSSVNLDEVLLVADDKGVTVGAPTVDGATVTATVVEQARGDKIIVFKKKRRKDYRRTKGHRQLVTVLRINEVLGKGQKRSAAKAKTPAKEPVKEPAPESTKEEAKPAAKQETKPAAEKPAPESTKEESKPAAKPAAKKAAPKKAPAKKLAAKAAAKKPATKKPAAKKPAAGKSGAKEKK